MQRKKKRWDDDRKEAEKEREREMLPSTCYLRCVILKSWKAGKKNCRKAWFVVGDISIFFSFSFLDRQFVRKKNRRFFHAFSSSFFRRTIGSSDH